MRGDNDHDGASFRSLNINITVATSGKSGLALAGTEYRLIA